MKHYDRTDLSTQKLRPEDARMIKDYLESLRDILISDFPDIESEIFEARYAGTSCSDSIPVFFKVGSQSLMERMGSLYPFHQTDGKSYASFTTIQIAIDSIFVQVTPQSKKVYLGREFHVHQSFETGRMRVRTPLEELIGFASAFNGGYGNYIGFNGEITERKWRERTIASIKQLDLIFEEAENFEDPLLAFAAMKAATGHHQVENPPYVFGHNISRTYKVDLLSESSIEQDIRAFLNLGYQFSALKK